MATNKIQKIAMQKNIASLLEGYLGHVKVNGATSDGTMFLNAIDSRSGRYTSDGIEVSGFLAANAGNLSVVKFALHYEEFNRNGKRLSDHVVMQNHVAALRKAVLAYEKQNLAVSLPVLAKHLSDDIMLFWKGDVESLRFAIAGYTGANVTLEDVAWIRKNLEKGFKSLSASVIAGTELKGRNVFMVVLPSIGIAMDGAAVMSHRNSFCEFNSIALGEGVQIRGFLRKMAPSAPWEVGFNYIKGVSWSLLAEDVVKVFDNLWFATSDEARNGLDYAKIRNWVVDHVNDVIITTTDVAKRSNPGVFAVTHLMVNYYGHKKESATRRDDNSIQLESVTAGVQVATRNFGFISGNNHLAKAASKRVNAVLSIVKNAITGEFDDAKRLSLLKAFDHIKEVKDDELDTAAVAGRMTSDFDEVHARLREVGISLSGLNYEGKLASACQSLVRKSLRVKSRKAYRAYNLPAFLVSAITGETMEEGTVYLPEDVRTALGVKTNDFVLIGRDPRLWHALMPVRISSITTYLRGVSEKSFIIDGFDTDGLRDQSDYDGDAKVVFLSSFEKFDFDAAVKSVIRDLEEYVAWVKNGGDIDELPAIKSLVSSKVEPFFTCQHLDEIGMAYFGTLYAAGGIEKGDSIATAKAINMGSMLTWDETVLVQKIIESVKHSSPDSRFFLINMLSRRYRSTADSLFFALKSKKENAVDAASVALAKYVDTTVIADDLVSVVRSVFADVIGVSHPLMESSVRWAYIANELVKIPRSGSAYFAKTPVRRHDAIIAWLLGDKRLARVATAYDEKTGKDYVLSGSLRLLGEYRDAVQNRAIVMSDAGNHDAVEASEMIAAAAGEITFAKQLAKRRILGFAQVVAAWANFGWRISDPQTVEYKGFKNAVFDEESKARFTSSFASIGLDFSGKADRYFWTMSEKMGKYYRLWNDLVQECSESEDAFATAMSFIADALFRFGHSFEHDGKLMKDFLFFIGENAVVELRRQWASLGFRVSYMTEEQERSSNARRRK